MTKDDDMSYIEYLAGEIATNIYYCKRDEEGMAALRDNLLLFAKEIKRSAIEP